MIFLCKCFCALCVLYLVDFHLSFLHAPLPSLLTSPPFSPPLPSHLPSLLTSPPFSPPLSSHLPSLLTSPYLLTSPTFSPPLPSHLPSLLTSPPFSPPLSSHLPSLTSPLFSSPLPSHLFRIMMVVNYLHSKDRYQLWLIDRIQRIPEGREGEGLMA